MSALDRLLLYITLEIAICTGVYILQSMVHKKPLDLVTVILFATSLANSIIMITGVG